MLQLNNNSIDLGTRICLPEKWHEKLTQISKCKKVPYEYSLVEITKVIRETYYICESAEKNKKFRVAFTEYPLRYLFAREVQDSNIGLSFKEYLPLEGSKILITNTQNLNEVVPASFFIDNKLEEINDESIISFIFKVDYLNGSGFSDVRFFTEGNKKSTWKFLMHSDESYMSDYEKMFKDTIIHKEYVTKSVDKLAMWLEKERAIEHAKLLRARAMVHDNSKLSCDDELHALARIINDKSSLMDASKQLTPLKKDAIALHWKNNSHHPEHFQTPMDMSKLDIMEMCCDWYARSMQYGTNFLEYVQKQQEIRFHFPDWMFCEIWQYCKILASDF